MQAAQLKKMLNDYLKITPERLKIIDAYMLYIFLTGIAQLIYRLLLDWTSPFKTFLSGFISTLTCFALAFCLRMNVNDEIEAVKIDDDKAVKDKMENEEIENDETAIEDNDQDEANEANDVEETTTENDEKEAVEVNNENKVTKEKDEDDDTKLDSEKKAMKEDGNEATDMCDENKSLNETSENEATKVKKENKLVMLINRYKAKFSHISTERAFVEFIIAHAIFHLIVMNFLS